MSDVIKRIKGLVHRLETDEMFRKSVESQFLYDWLNTKTDEEQAQIMLMWSYILPPPTRVDNGDGTYTYTWTPNA